MDNLFSYSMENYTSSKLYYTENWTKEEIIYLLMSLYMGLLVGTMLLYLRSMHTQYKNAHNKWYGINDSPKRTKSSKLN